MERNLWDKYMYTVIKKLYVTHTEVPQFSKTKHLLSWLANEWKISNCTAVYWYTNICSWFALSPSGHADSWGGGCLALSKANVLLLNMSFLGIVVLPSPLAPRSKLVTSLCKVDMKCNHTCMSMGSATMQIYTIQVDWIWFMLIVA